MRAILLAVLVLIPSGLFAATVNESRTLVSSEPIPDNAYLFGGDLTVAGPITGDLMAGGANVVVSAPITGDALLAGGSIEVRKPISGDARAAGVRLMFDGPVAGDLMAIGGTVTVNASPSYAWIIGGQVNFVGGARGPVTIYGSSVALSGVFDGDVDVVASDRVSLAEGTVIHGELRYDAPQQADMPTSVIVDGGVKYTGKSYLPTTEEAKTFAVAGAGIFFLVRILAAIIAAGLLVGLFPVLAQAVADQAFTHSLKHFILLALLGFGILVAAPILALLLLLTFAGAGLAFILIAAYVLLILLSYVYAAVIAGSALARGVVKRPQVLWRDGVIGMLALSVITLVPVLGTLVLFILVAASAGALMSLFYRFAYPRDTDPFDVS